MTELVPARWLAPAAIVIVAALLTLPAALGPVRLNDSFWIDWVWLDQFARELGQGTLYPRWLPMSHDGLGSPVFYYYPPIAFYLASAFSLFGLKTYLALVAAFFAAFVLSGATMFAWLKGQVRNPLFGSLVFMITPYHVFNFYQRGAIAEFLATALLPLVMLGIRRVAMNERSGVWITALAYGALIATHLPLALLASLFLFLPYGLVSSRASPSLLLRLALPFVIGTALAAIYLVPALALEPFRDSAKLWAFPYLQPASWTVWDLQSWSDKSFRAALLMLATISIPILSLLFRGRSGWAIWAIVCGVLAVGILPFLWDLPGLRSVQFPFRLLPVAEFAFATAIAFAPRSISLSRVVWLPLIAMAGFVIVAKPADVSVTLAELQSLHPDVPENLPPGERPYSWPSTWALQLAARHRSAQFDGDVTVEPSFYFPSWRVRCGGRVVSTYAAPESQLLAHDGANCSRSLRWTVPERIGAAISALAFLLLLLLASVPRLRTGRIRRNGSRPEVHP